MSEEEKKGIVENTGVLNLKSITEEGIEQLRKIRNVGVVIVPEKFVGKITAKMENVGVVVPYKEGMRIYTGKSKINADMLKNVEEPISILNSGKLIVEKDATTELISQKIKEIRNYGKIIVPKLTYGVIASKVSENTGKIEVLEEVIEEKTKELQKELEELRKLSEG
ncbi:hypothetical protein J7L49_03475 [Candidatus Bathyarchaeota archaeon]|nr:hypothetical protein [Candidatus Bathyarchaeota archaeon]